MSDPGRELTICELIRSDARFADVIRAAVDWTSDQGAAHKRKSRRRWF
jgi:hypothetical protein